MEQNLKEIFIGAVIGALAIISIVFMCWLEVYFRA